MTVPIAGVQPDQEELDALGAQLAVTGRRRKATEPTSMPSDATTPDTPTSDGHGSEPAASASASTSPTSSSSDRPSTGSTRRYRRPRTVREFAAQANSVATAILNGDIDIDRARAYSSVARTVAQAMSTEVVRARFMQMEPDLTFDIPEEDE